MIPAVRQLYAPELGKNWPIPVKRWDISNLSMSRAGGAEMNVWTPFFLMTLLN
jgi:hypothetical protein